MRQDLTALPPECCPVCRHATVTLTSWQPALFVGCDYGQALAHTVRRCYSCGWEMLIRVESVSPRVFA